jgi:hypothetical protein
VSVIQAPAVTVGTWIVPFSRGNPHIFRRARRDSNPQPTDSKLHCPVSIVKMESHKGASRPRTLGISVHSRHPVHGFHGICCQIAVRMEGNGSARESVRSRRFINPWVCVRCAYLERCGETRILNGCMFNALRWPWFPLARPSLIIQETNAYA